MIYSKTKQKNTGLRNHHQHFAKARKFGSAMLRLLYENS
jgi:hypothetical protein